MNVTELLLTIAILLLLSTTDACVARRVNKLKDKKDDRQSSILNKSSDDFYDV